MSRPLTHPPSVVTSAAAPSAAELALGMRRPSTPPPRPERAREAGQPIDRFVEQAVKRNIPARHVLLRAGEPRDVLFYMISGSAEVLVEDDQGKQMILVYLDKGHFFGSMVPVSGDNRSVLVRTRCRSEIAEMPYARFQRLAAEHPLIALELAAQLAARLESATRKLRDLAFVDVSGRIEQTLKDLCEHADALTHPEGMQLRISRQELARLVGCSREMAGRVLKTLEQEGVLRAHGKTVVMLDYRPAKKTAQTVSMAARSSRNVAA
ncbi:MAG: cyclic nucleotide-binding domain-containing protein [Steroidobacteraceae bacterium]